MTAPVSHGSTSGSEKKLPGDPVAVKSSYGQASAFPQLLKIFRRPSNTDSLPAGTDSAPGATTSVVKRALEVIEKECQQNLSQLAKEFLQLPEMRRLERIPNSAMAFTKIFGHLNFSRGRHSRDAAAQVAKLKLPLSNHERAVLEIALLFHDIGHVPGSHAMDKVFASMKKAPQIGKWGYGRDEYHELHGAQIVGRGPANKEIRKQCGEALFGDLMAVLSFDDKRPHNEKVITYGPFSPTLTENQIKRLYDLKDRLDRTSYLKFDYLFAGYGDDVVADVLEHIERYHESLFLTESGVGTEHVSTSGANDDQLDQGDPYLGIVNARGTHFSNIPAHPTNGLISAVMQHAVWEQLQNSGVDRDKLESSEVYRKIRNDLLSGKYEQVFGKEVWGWLHDRQRCVTDYVAPLVTLKTSDFTEMGKLALLKIREREAVLESETAFPAAALSNICGAPMYDATALELRIRDVLATRGISTPVYFVISVNLDKKLTHPVRVNGKVKEKEYSDEQLRSLEGHVIIAARAYDDEGRLVDLSALQSAISKVMAKSGWLSNPSVIQEEYNPRVFVEPSSLAVFTAEVQRKMSLLCPIWLKAHSDTPNGIAAR